MSDNSRPTAPPADRSGRRRARRLLGLVGLAVALGLASKLRAPVEDRIRLGLAERAVAAGRLDEAEDRLDAIIEAHPTRPRPWFLRAQVARRRGQVTEAEERLQRAVDLGLPVEVARPEHDLLKGLTEPASADGSTMANDR